MFTLRRSDTLLTIELRQSSLFQGSWHFKQLIMMFFRLPPCFESDCCRLFAHAVTAIDDFCRLRCFRHNDRAKLSRLAPELRGYELGRPIDYWLLSAVS